MRILLRLSLAVLILCVPLTAILTTENLIVRTPDLYRYEFTSAQAAHLNNLSISEEELAAFFSDFMLGKEEQFTLETEIDEQKQNQFTIYEGILMEQARTFLNWLTFVLAVCILLASPSVWLLIRYDLKDMLRWAYKVSWSVFIFLWVAVGATFAMPSLRNRVFSFIAGGEFGEDSLLLRLITPEFIKDWLLAGLGISVIVMALLGSLLWKLSKPKLMFR